jgi:hypothetical protein
MLASVQMVVAISFYLTQEDVSDAFRSYLAHSMLVLSQKDIIIKDIQAF